MRFIYLVSLLLLSTWSFAQSSQLKLAKNSMAKLHRAVEEKADAKKQLSIIGEGIKAIELAEKDKKSKKWPDTWAIKAYFSSYVALIDNNESNINKHTQQALEALEKAKDLDKYQANQELINAAEYNLIARKQIEATVLFKQGDYQTAFPILKEISNYFTTDTLMSTNTALCALNLHQYNDALHYFERSKQHGVKNPIVYQQIAAIYTSKFEIEKAIKTLEEGLKINPQQSLLLNDYLNLLLDNNELDKAQQVVTEMLGSQSNNRLLLYLKGYLAQNAKDYKIAEDAYKKTINLDHNFFDAYYQLALIYLQQANEALTRNEYPKFSSNINRAEFTLNRALEINQHNRQVITLLMEIYTRKNRFDKVQELKRQLNEL